MKLTKKLTTLAIVGAISATTAKIKDQAQAEAEFNKSVAPLLQKENDEVNKIAQPMMQNIHNAIESVRVEKKMDVVLDDPYTIRAADANSNVENITDEVIKRLKK